MVLQCRQRLYKLQFPHLDILLVKIQTLGSCGLKETEGAVLAFIIMKPKYVNILLYLAREAELWVKLNCKIKQYICQGKKKYLHVYLGGRKKKKQTTTVTQKSFGLVW